MRQVFWATVAVGVLLTNGCAMSPIAPSRDIPEKTLQTMEGRIDMLLDYSAGKTDALPEIPNKTGTPSKPDGGAVSVRELALSMRGQYPAIAALAREGITGETSRGYLVLREDALTGGADRRNEVQQLIAEENRDRKALLRELTRLHDGGAVTISMMEHYWWLRRIARAESGTHFELPAAGAVFDRFKAGPEGARLGTACVPEAWVVMP